MKVLAALGVTLGIIALFSIVIYLTIITKGLFLASAAVTICFLALWAAIYSAMYGTGSDSW